MLILLKNTVFTVFLWESKILFYQSGTINCTFSVTLKHKCLLYTCTLYNTGPYPPVHLYTAHYRSIVSCTLVHCQLKVHPLLYTCTLHTTVQYSVKVKCSAVQYSIVEYITIHRSAVQYITLIVYYCSVLFSVWGLRSVRRLEHSPDILDNGFSSLLYSTLQQGIFFFFFFIFFFFFF